MTNFFRVGVFDSGIGGLTVLNECARTVCADYVYFGDNKRAPYGNRSKEEITCFVREGLQALARFEVDAAILACNTATTVCIGQMRKEFAFPILGTEPAVAPAAKRAENILVLATVRTAQSERLHALLKKFPQCRFTVFGAEGLAGAIENFCTKGEKFTLSDYLPKGNFGGVVLGCTHYVFFKKQISDFYSAPVFDGNQGVSERLKTVLSGTKTALSGISNHKKGQPTTWHNTDIIRDKFTNSHIIFTNSNKNCNKQTYKRMFVS